MYNVDVDGSSLLHLAVNSGVLGVRMFISIDHRFASCFYLEIFSEKWTSNFQNNQKQGQPNPTWYTLILANLFPKIRVPFYFYFFYYRHFRDFRLKISSLEEINSAISRFSGNFPRIFLYHLSLFQFLVGLLQTHVGNFREVNG